MKSETKHGRVTPEPPLAERAAPGFPVRGIETARKQERRAGALIISAAILQPGPSSKPRSR